MTPAQEDDGRTPLEDLTARHECLRAMIELLIDRVDVPDVELRRWMLDVLDRDARWGAEAR